MSLRELALKAKAREYAELTATALVNNLMAAIIREDPSALFERSIPSLLQVAKEEFAREFDAQVKRRELQPSCPRHASCEDYLPREECDYRSGRISYEEAEREAEEAFERWTARASGDGHRAADD